MTDTELKSGWIDITKMYEHRDGTLLRHSQQVKCDYTHVDDVIYVHDVDTATTEEWEVDCVCFDDISSEDERRLTQLYHDLNNGRIDDITTLGFELVETEVDECDCTRI